MSDHDDASASDQTGVGHLASASRTYGLADRTRQVDTAVPRSPGRVGWVELVDHRRPGPKRPHPVLGCPRRHDPDEQRPRQHRAQQQAQASPVTSPVTSPATSPVTRPVTSPVG